MIDFIIGGIFAYLIVGIAAAQDAFSKKKETPMEEHLRKSREAWERSKTDVDPVTGDYTKRGTHERFNKHGQFIGIVEKRGGE